MMTSSRRAEELLSVENIRVQFRANEPGLAAVDDVSFQLARGRSLTIVGESGAGKSQLALAIARLQAPHAQVTGRVWWGTTDLMALSASAMREWRGAMIAVVFQDALLALAPHLTIGRQLTEVLTAHQPQIGRAAARQAALESLQDVQLSDPVRCLSQYPHELSGGMLQRVMIAMALIGKPQLLILDEPTSALDALVRQDIIRLLQRLRDRGIRLLCITHDVAVAARLGDELAVMLGGQLVETGATADILKAPQHPYTRALLASQITLATTRHGNIPTMPEAEPVNAPGCVFASRCHSAVTTCQATPALRWIGSRQVRCHQPWLGLD